MKKEIAKIVEDTVRLKERGFANLKNDTGGKTMWGITEAVAKENEDLWETYGFSGDMRKLPLAMAYAIYRKRYWNTQCLDKVFNISPILAEEMFDTGVNTGIRFPQESLQRCLNVLNLQGTVFKDLVVDGDVGPATLDALEAFYNYRGNEGLAVLYTMMNSLQAVKYIELAENKETQEDFVYGWNRARVLDDLRHNLVKLY